MTMTTSVLTTSTTRITTSTTSSTSTTKPTSPTTTTTVSTTGPYTVIVKNYLFQPQMLTVLVGATVTWVNQDSDGHTATSDTGLFDLTLVGSGGTNGWTFTKAGTYYYHCSLHTEMVGTIVVQ